MSFRSTFDESPSFRHHDLSIFIACSSLFSSANETGQCGENSFLTAESFFLNVLKSSSKNESRFFLANTSHNYEKEKEDLDIESEREKQFIHINIMRERKL